jgi:ATP citrate (pro-S)-lyase
VIKISDLRNIDMRVLSLGSHPGVVQAMMDYDFLSGKQQPSMVGIIARGKKQERYFWGESEVVIPVFEKISDMPDETIQKVTAIVNVQSARRVLSTTTQAMEQLPNLKVVNIFAEQTPEAHSLQLIELSKKYNVLVTGPSSVGLLLPGVLKLGAIGGTQHKQLSEAGIIDAGDTAVISTSGGIVNELIHTVTGSGLGVSFAIALGGDRYPITTPAHAMLLAEDDPQTERIVFFGELGGTDEYEIAKLIKKGKITKEIIVYIAGTVAELFENPPQFGHAKAMAQTYDESATAKKELMKVAGAIVCDSFGDIETELRRRVKQERIVTSSRIGERHRSMIISHLSGDKNQDVQLLGNDLLTTVESNSIASLTLSMLLGHQVTSQKAIDFVDYVLRLLVDHGPYVSGALNTIVTARAGKDMVSSLTAGLLTIGPRFGGAINAASENWLKGVHLDQGAYEFIEEYSLKGGIVPGIGHKKYRLDLPDPRVASLEQFTGNANGDRYLAFARRVEAITTTKKANLILNVDGMIAAVMLDILESEMGYTNKQLLELVDIEFFNSLFIISRTIGFTSHYLDQRRHDEGLFRLSDDDVRYIG